MSFLYDGHKHINGNTDPDLSLHRVFGSSIKFFDTQMLFDPFEKQFYPPSAFVKLCNGQGRQFEVVGQKSECFPDESIVIFDAAQFFGIVLGGIVVGKMDFLIAKESGFFVDEMRINSFGFQIGFGSDDKESKTFCNLMESGEVEVTPVHNVE